MDDYLLQCLRDAERKAHELLALLDVCAREANRVSSHTSDECVAQIRALLVTATVADQPDAMRLLSRAIQWRTAELDDQMRVATEISR